MHKRRRAYPIAGIEEQTSETERIARVERPDRHVFSHQFLSAGSWRQCPRCGVPGAGTSIGQPMFKVEDVRLYCSAYKSSLKK